MKKKYNWGGAPEKDFAALSEVIRPAIHRYGCRYDEIVVKCTSIRLVEAIAPLIAARKEWMRIYPKWGHGQTDLEIGMLDKLSGQEVRTTRTLKGVRETMRMKDIVFFEFENGMTDMVVVSSL